MAYLDITASHQLIAEVEELDELARERRVAAVLSVGLVPGVTNLLGRYCAERAPSDELRLGVLLGSGEKHGPAAVEWTVDGLGKLKGIWTMQFPSPFGRRVVRRFPFSDQYTMRRTLRKSSIQTGFCLDTRLANALLAAADRPVVARLLRHPRWRAAITAALAWGRLGSDAFAVTAQAGTVRASLSGRRQGAATGIVAALLVRRIFSVPPGVHHIEQVIDPIDFMSELTSHGFEFEVSPGNA